MKPALTPLDRCRLAAFALLLGLTLVAGCKTAPPLPPADLSSPGWRVQNGQAIWKPGSRHPELVGDLIMATNVDGRAFVQFTKDPFPLATAQTTSERWQINFSGGHRSWRGRGQPPRFFLWFQLPPALRGEELKSPWKFSHTGDSWRLENPRRGEWLEGRFFE